MYLKAAVQRHTYGRWGEIDLLRKDREKVGACREIFFAFSPVVIVKTELPLHPFVRFSMFCVHLALRDL